MLSSIGGVPLGSIRSGRIFAKHRGLAGQMYTLADINLFAYCCTSAHRMFPDMNLQARAPRVLAIGARHEPSSGVPVPGTAVTSQTSKRIVGVGGGFFAATAARMSCTPA